MSFLSSIAVSARISLKKFSSSRSCFAVVAFVILLTQGLRKIPVQYAKRVVGRRVYGGQQHIVLRINTAGVIPIIFAQSIMFLPGTIHADVPRP